MPAVMIWTLESPHDANAVKRLAEKLVEYRGLENLSIHTTGGNSVLKPRVKGETSSDRLRKAVWNYLRDYVCVILITDNDGPMSAHQRRQEQQSLINQIERVANDRRLKGKVYSAQAVQELEAWLLIDCLGISCYFASKRQRYKQNCRDKVSQNRSLGRLVNRYQRGDTELIVEPESGSRGAKEYLERFSEEIQLELNPNMPAKNVRDNRYREKMSPDIAEYVIINKETLRRNKSFRHLGNLLTKFS